MNNQERLVTLLTNVDKGKMDDDGEYIEHDDFYEVYNYLGEIESI